MGRPKCTSDACRSPVACTGWQYCRLRNVAAGGMENVTFAMQEEWIAMDTYGNKWGVYASDNDLRATFETAEEAHGYITSQPEGYCGLSVWELGT